MRFPTIPPPLAMLNLLCASVTLFATSPGGEFPEGQAERDLRAAYARADQMIRDYPGLVNNLRITPNWLDGGKRFWFRDEPAKNRRTFVMVDSGTGARSAAFDHGRLAEALTGLGGGKVSATNLPFRDVTFDDDGKAIRFDYLQKTWRYEFAARALGRVERPVRPVRPVAPETTVAEPSSYPSPDGEWMIRIQENNLLLRASAGPERHLTESGTASSYFDRVYWSPDSKSAVAVRVTAGDRKPVYLLQSSPAGERRAKLEARTYDQPGDRVDKYELSIIDPEKGEIRPIAADPVDYGDMPSIHWKADQHRFTYERMDRGYGRWRIIEVDARSGQSKTLVDEDPPTFVDSTALYTYYCERTDEILFRSERDGWGHLYLASDTGAPVRQITKGNWVVRSVEHIDEDKRQIIFGASGVNPREDPYFVHYYRIGFNGQGFTPLTPEPGNHSIQMSPDATTLVDTYSTIATPPTHELRRVEDGEYLATLGKADITGLRAVGWRAPEAFVAKGRDGKTDIFGVVFRPQAFDPKRKYPVVEDVYAGPQDSFVPKSFLGGLSTQALAELGFIVVKADGMGTRNRSKAFHDVCYKNIADAGFPDRIAWIKAFAKKEPSMDLSRVGIYGTSAGGQSAAGALLFHPDFYQVAVASCGCHDNRMDKIWWNEQWMGYPVGPEYEQQSNITHAADLRGHLLLMVGELDHNVPPESTFRFADALIKADREFDLVVLPGQDHTSGGAYGDRKRRDFLVRHLLGVEPPRWNRQPSK